MELVDYFPALDRPSTPVCSVCIANFNGEGLLGECIDSVMQQVGGLSIEIIVHDDASSDDSIGLLRGRYPNVEILQSKENVGFCLSNNRMVAHARGEYILLLNNDASLFPDAIESLIEAARSHNTAGIFSLPQFDWESGNLVDRGCLLDIFYNPVPNLKASTTEVAMVIGACLFMRRSLWNELGGFPTWMGSIAEDMYLCCLSRLQDKPIIVSTISGYRHRQGATFGGNRETTSGLQTTFRRRRLSEQNKISVAMICTPTWLVSATLLLHAVLLLLEGLVLSLLKWDHRIFRDIYGPAINHLVLAPKRLASLRRQVQSKRTISLGQYLSRFTAIPRKLILVARHGLPRIG